MSQELRTAADAVDFHVEEYVEGYEFYGEDEQGREGSYAPTKTERMLIADAIHGLLADDGFVSRFNHWQDLARAEHGKHE